MRRNTLSKEHYLNFDEYINEEVYIVAPSGLDDPDQCDEISLFDSYEDLSEHLQTLDPELYKNRLVAHGILADSQVLPTTIGKSTAFIIIKQHNNQGIMFESSAQGNQITELANEIETLLMNSKEFMPWLGYDIDIDDVYIVYGYSLTTGLSVDEDDVDEEAVEVAKKITLETEAIKESYNIDQS